MWLCVRGIYGFFTLHCLVLCLYGSPDQRIGRVLVIANSNSAASLEMAVAYRHSRHLPPENFLPLDFLHTKTIRLHQLHKYLLDPLKKKLEALGENIDYVVFTRDVPYRTGDVSLPSIILSGGYEKMLPVQGYFNQRSFFESCIPYNQQYLLPTTILSGATIQEGLQLIESGRTQYHDISQSGTFYFCDGKGARGVRNRWIPETIRFLSANGIPCKHVRTPDIHNRQDVLGQFTGATKLDLESNHYLPGSIVDNLTSFGGYLLDPRGHVTLLDFVRYGVSGGYGTVWEPTNNLSRWATFMLPILYASGYSLMESYLQSVKDWRFGLVIGDPLMAPFGKYCSITIKKEQEHYQRSDEVRVHLQVKKPQSGYGISWVEVWLNDRERIYLFEPVIPKDVQWNLRLIRDERLLFSKNYITKTKTKLRDIVASFTQEKKEEITLQPVGKRKNKILIRWHPKKDIPHNIPIKAILDITMQGKTYPIHQVLTPLPLQRSVVEYNFGVSSPFPGDKIIIRVGNKSFSYTAKDNEMLSSFLQRVQQDLEKELVSIQAPWKIKYRSNSLRLQSLESPAILAKPWHIIRIQVKRQPHSSFAKIPRPKKQSIITIGYLWEGILQPRWPISALNQEIIIPQKMLAVGDNVITVQAGSLSGNQAYEEIHIPIVDVLMKHNFLINTPLSLGQDLKIEYDVGVKLKDAVPKVYLDGIPIGQGKPGRKVLRIPLHLPLVSPGSHQLSLEWMDGTSSHAYPLARSRSQEIFIRRPLLSGARFKPHTVKAGDRSSLLQVTGAYLHEEVLFWVHENILPHWRKNSTVWLVDTSDLDPGEYPLKVTGNPALEEEAVFPEFLTVIP